jgi:hypothetical protein
MDESLVALDSGHQFSSSGTHPLSFSLSKKLFFGGYQEPRFFLMRHNAIFDQVVDFEENFVGKLCVSWSHGACTHEGARDYGVTLLCHTFLILCS